MNDGPGAKTIPLFDPVAERVRRALGALVVELSGAKKELPLGAVEIFAKVADRIAEVQLTQKFRNTFSDHMEAVYIFPLAASSVVKSFEMKIGDRTVVGVVKERQEARQEYRAALEAGKQTAMMEQERDDVFTMQVGNIKPGEEITVVLSYCERLAFFEDGSSEIRLPLVVAPRYIAGTPVNSQHSGHGVECDTDKVKDASRISPPRLLPGAKDNLDLKITVEIEKGLTDNKNFEISNIVSSQHVIDTELSNGNLKVELAQAEELMNRDFVLKWTIAGETVKPSFLTYTDDKGESYCLLSMFSPKQEKFLGVPRDVIFVVDRSGSMEGLKMASAAKSCSILLDTLGPRDRFAILSFDTENEWMRVGVANGDPDTKFLVADEAGIEKGKDYLRTISARGGTNLEGAIRETLSDLDNRRNKDASGIVVVLTDGEIGDESGVLKCLQKDLQSSRLFAIGVDSAVNSGLLTRMAALGGGTAALVAPGAKLEKALSQIGREIGVPLLTDLKIESVNGEVIPETTTPENLPDLFRGRAITCFFKMKAVNTGGGKRKIRVSGVRADGKQYVDELVEKQISLGALAPLYAKSRIRDLEDAFREDRNRDQAKKQMIELSIQHQILCRFTAYLAIADGEVVNKDGALRTVVQPVPMPMAWGAAPGASIGGGFYGSARRGINNLAIGSQSATGNLSSGSDTWGGGTPVPPLPPSSGLPPSAPPPMPAAHQQSIQWGFPISSRSSESKAENLRADSSNARDADSAQKDKAVVAATRHLLKLFDEIEEKFNSQQVIDWEILDSARQTCMTILQMSTHATRAAILQQFVRKEAIEIIAAIKADGLTKEHVESYLKIREALKLCLDDIASGREPAVTLGAPFWEDTI